MKFLNIFQNLNMSSRVSLFGILCLSWIAFVHSAEEESADVNFNGDSMSVTFGDLALSQPNNKDSNCENLRTELEILTQKLQSQDSMIKGKKGLMGLKVNLI